MNGAIQPCDNTENHMLKQYFGVLLILLSFLVLSASGNLGALPILLPCAAVTGYLIVRYSGHRTALSLSSRKR